MNTEERMENTPDQAGQGYLIIHATTARGSIPLEGVQVNVLNALPEFTQGRGDVIISVVTGRDGNTMPIPLPVPPRENSLHPGSVQKPYATYHVEVRQEGYFDQNYFHIPVFDGITAIQPADLIPLPENGRTDSRTPDGERFFESSTPEL